MRHPLVPGVYDLLLDDALSAVLSKAEAENSVEREPLEPAEVPRYLADHVRGLLERVLGALRGDETKTHERRVAIANRMLHALAAAAKDLDEEDLVDRGEDSVITPPQRLLGVRRRDPLVVAAPLERPEIPLSQSAILVNAPDEPSLGSELRRELASADNVDLLVAFLKWSGLRILQDRLGEIIARGGRVRVLTTTYIGASDARAVHELAALGANVRISYDTRRTRLHAKAWMFTRGSGAHTAYVGSSNLSSAALHDGLEWNVRLSERDAAPLLKTFRAAFESYWASDEFIPYDPASDRPRVERALAQERNAGAAFTTIGSFDLAPHPYQANILEALEVERGHGHSRNLVVAPTGTGKTLVAAFDYQRLRKTLPRARLLFIAHRERILEQSRTAFRQVLRDGTFGELLVGGQRPSQGEHVFASVQSLARVALDPIEPDRFDVVVVDEFHHAEAPTYERLLDHLRPRVLLGLTATPERHDGRDVRRWFNGRTAYEMRLWDALEQGLLAPFQYFGTHDGVALDDVAWKRAGYDRAALSAVYTGNDARLRLVLREVEKRVVDPKRMRALGFCVGVEHARFMAERFTRAGIASIAVSGESTTDEIESAIASLEAGRIQAIFTVDLFNEGIDIPSVDTILFLRPTESATVFLQQFGRGLRLHDSKGCLTVLDFIGGARREFRFDRRFRALLNGTTKSAARQIEEGFPYLPPGCAIALDRVARDVVLRNIKEGIGSGKKWLTEELVAVGRGATLGEFIEKADVDLIELYENRRSFTSLRTDAFGLSPMSDEAKKTHARLGALLHINDVERFATFQAFARSNVPPSWGAASPRERRMLHMLISTIAGNTPFDALEERVVALWRQAAFRGELSALLAILEDRCRDSTWEWTDPRKIRPAPLRVHGRYRQEEVLAGLHVLRSGSIPRIQGGVFFVEEENVDLLFVTLRKTEASFSPSTMYSDYAISPKLFHWESQNSAHAESPTGKRYIDGSSTVLLFVRDHQKESNGIAQAYVFLGPVRMKEWSGERPMQIVWALEREMPGALFQRATVAAG